VAVLFDKLQRYADYLQAREIVSQSSGLEQTRALAQEYVDKAIEAISFFPESEAKTGLVEMCTKVMKRRK
jgi:hexaprenyl-diphosphate synthase